jgi:hypothetical protein
MAMREARERIPKLNLNLKYGFNEMVCDMRLSTLTFTPPVEGSIIDVGVWNAGYPIR